MPERRAGHVGRSFFLASFCLSKKKRKKDTFSLGVSHSLVLMGTAHTG
jgi:hypothetical protein